MKRIAWGLAGASAARTTVALALACVDRSAQLDRTLAGVSQLLVASTASTS